VGAAFDGCDALHILTTPQDDENGGIADRPGDMADVFHTYFGLCGLSLMGEPGLKPIDPVYALPVDTLTRGHITPTAL